MLRYTYFDVNRSNQEILGKLLSFENIVENVAATKIEQPMTSLLCLISLTFQAEILMMLSTGLEFTEVCYCKTPRVSSWRIESQMQVQSS